MLNLSQKIETHGTLQASVATLPNTTPTMYATAKQLVTGIVMLMNLV